MRPRLMALALGAVALVALVRMVRLRAPPEEPQRVPGWRLPLRSASTAAPTRSTIVQAPTAPCDKLTGPDRTIFKHLEFNLEYRSRTKLLCLVQTHGKQHRRAQDIARSWGRECDRTIFFTDQVDSDLRGSLKLDHDGPENYGNMWQKVRAIWAMVAEEWAEEYDWFYMCGDDTLVFVKNLMKYLDGLSVEEPLYLGRRMMYARKTVFNSGASYVLNRKAVQAWRSHQNHSICNPRLRVSHEDLMMGE
eukprot:TRINITY_DN26427_c0_g1_i2.p1 TRINITY_DN26427_c0_g1~~TRINITY_DN26427_c0_g1_i2.p1  ORF type:complete len:248 (+),score=34.99 TRINITY_DN26427_c0_g1_i2:230-973(+)